uniref:Mitochondrial inner membrane protein COX18 n=1 Tax=Panagrellus redivivus TaxID=6233 RepID=A0A7E4V3B2_PANRE
MDVIHSTGLGWGATFVATGLVLRAATAPAHVFAEKLFAKRMHATNYIHQTLLKRVGEHYRVKVVPNEEGTKLVLKTNDKAIQAKAESLSDEHIATYVLQNKLQATRIQNLKMFTVPIWIFSSFAIRNVISGDFTPAIPGALWINDLLMPDPYLVLPAMVGIFGFINLYSQRFIYPVKMTSWRMRGYDAALALITIVAVRIMMDLPACIPLYWLVVSTSGMAQNMILRHPKVKTALGIPRLPTDSNTPLRDLFLMRRPKV